MLACLYITCSISLHKYLIFSVDCIYLFGCKWVTKDEWVDVCLCDGVFMCLGVYIWLVCIYFDVG